MQRRRDARTALAADPMLATLVPNMLAKGESVAAVAKWYRLTPEAVREIGGRKQRRNALGIRPSLAREWVYKPGRKQWVNEHLHPGWTLVVWQATGTAFGPKRGTWEWKRHLDYDSTMGRYGTAPTRQAAMRAAEAAGGKRRKNKQHPMCPPNCPTGFRAGMRSGRRNSSHGKGKSKGSIGFSGTWEFFIAPDGDLYKAPVYNPLDVHGYRQGYRFEATAANDHGDKFGRYLRVQGFDKLTKTPDSRYTRSNRGRGRRR